MTDSDVTFATAYTVDRDGDAHQPSRNFMKVVPEELSRDEFDVLIYKLHIFFDMLLP